MVKKSAEMAYTSKQVKSSKWLLLLCAASAAAVDIAIVILLLIGGMGVEYFICPIVLFVFDAVYFVVSLCFTNFRFKYSMAVWLSYVLLFTLGVAVELAILLGGAGTVISNVALITWSVVHALNILCAIITALFASRVMKSTWLGIVFAAVFVLCCGAYLAYSFLFGFFGQGNGSRPLVYKYDSAAGAYTAVDVLAGRSKKVVVPETFNGKPVTAVSFKVLTKSGINEYAFSAGLQFTDDSVLENQLNLENKTYYVDKAGVNEVRSKLYAYEGGEQSVMNAVMIANATLPSNLSGGEGYVAFAYDPEAFRLIKGNVIPVYVGNLASFDMDAYTADYDYIQYRNPENAEHLDRAYKAGGYILSDIVGANGSLLSGAITENTIAELKFDKIYRVTVESGNDTKYDEREVQPDFCFDTVDGGTLGYRYLTLGTAENFTDGLNARKGFSLQWLYYEDGAKKKLSSLPELLGSLSGSDVTVCPLWTLNAPEVSITSTAENNSIVYGENVTFTANATIEAEGVTFEYRWALGAEPSTDCEWDTQSVSLNQPKPDKSGEYKLAVLVHGGETTSLSAFTAASINLNINKKPIEFVWTAPEDLVYDGAEKLVRFDFDRSQLVGNDSIEYTVPIGSDNNGFVSVSAGIYAVKYAGTYSPKIYVSGADAANYDAGDSINYTFTVEKRHITADWSNYDSLVYNGALQGPSAVAIGVGGDGDVISEVSGRKVDAGENYSATATLGNANYILDNPDQTYSIKKAPLTVTAGSVSTVYGEAPDVSAIPLNYSGFVHEETVSVLGGAPVYAFAPSLSDGDEYAVGEYSEGVSVSGYTANNYEITYVGGTLTITQRAVVVGWRNADGLVYDAQEKNVTAYVSNVVGSDDVSLTVTGGNAVNYGVYTAEVTGLTGTRAVNYILADGLTREYTVSKAQITVTADDKTSVYGSATVELTATLEGVIYGEELAYEISCDMGEEEKLNAGEYDIICTLTQDNENYEVICVNGTYTVSPLAVEIIWANYDRLAYNGVEKNVTATVTNKVYAEDDVTVVVSGGNEKDAGGHTATAVSLDGEDAGNYSLPEGLTREYSIDQVRLSINIDNKTSVYGDPLEELTVTLKDGVIFNNEIEYELRKEEGANVGEYKITCTITKGLNDNNYQLSDYFISGTYTITAREITVNWSDYEDLVYDGNEKTVTGVIDNLAEGDEALVRFEGVTATEAGNYTARLVLDESIAGNYVVVNGTLDYTVAEATDIEMPGVDNEV